MDANYSTIILVHKIYLSRSNKKWDAPKAEWEIEISTKTIKRILKEFSMSWHRMRRGVRGKPDPLEYAEKKAKLKK